MFMKLFNWEVLQGKARDK